LSPCLTLIEQLAEHFNAGDHCLGRRLDPDDLDFLADLNDAALDSARADGAAAGNREHVFYRHQERLVFRPLRLRNVLIHRLHQSHDRFFAELLIAAFERLEGRAFDDGDLVAREIVLRQQLTNFKFDQLEQLRIVDHVDLVHVNDERRNTDLTGEQDVLAGLRHRAVCRGHHQDRAVHLSGAGDHVLHVVGVAWTIDVRVMALVGLILDVSGRNGDAARLLFRRLVDLVISGERRAALFSEHFGDRRRQRRLAVVDVTDRPDVAMGLGPLEFFFGHGTLRSDPSVILVPDHANFFCTSADTFAGSSE
jgi:hypothetical protein